MRPSVWQAMAVGLLAVWSFLSVAKVGRAETVDWIVAVVNDDVILNSELQRRVEDVVKAAGHLHNAAPLGPADALRKEVLRQMIRDKLTAQEVARLKITVTDSEVEEALASIQSANNMSRQQLEAMLQREGRSLEQFKKMIRQDMERARLIERVLKSKTLITDEQVQSALSREVRSPEEERHLAVIFLAAPKAPEARQAVRLKAQEILNRIRQGENFADLARAYSQGPEAQNGGDIGTIKAKNMVPALEQATRNLEPGQVSDVLESADGFYIIKLLDAKRPKLGEVDERVKEKVRQELFRMEVNRKYDQWIRDLEAKSYIQIHLDPPTSGS
ncbi:peptidylprolyl isomerase [Desulfosoma caldarium]|uniref:Periplasmic chaperone for outer membrane proteins SurA n=1 Tax=Desulfosoma caldarium TaxID=610254 RepID=A0A3N1V147_9BACT|nr:peptidylprolyl isomerase [Desulfosoma caldarium]ROQ93266.1 periplasmic chaperone for outer membrane proteins SurA [Desulfosoma caldarium]